MRIAIITAFHGRPSISRVFHLGIERLRKQFDARCFAAVTEGDVENMALCDSYGVPYVEHDNVDLGAKHNAALALAREWDPDLVVVLGSDDLVSNDHIQWATTGGDYVFPGAITLYTPGDKRGLMLEGPIQFGRTFFGAGRAYSRKVLDKLDWKPWSEAGLRKGLDNDSHFRVTYLTNTEPTVLEDGRPHVLDIKSGVNITEPGQFRGRATPIVPEAAMWFVGEEEREAIDALVKQHENQPA
jgi:hypothetical protein